MPEDFFGGCQDLFGACFRRGTRCRKPPRADRAVRAIMSAVYDPIINMPVKASNPPRVLQASPGSRSHPAVE